MASPSLECSDTLGLSVPIPMRPLRKYTLLYDRYVPFHPKELVSLPNLIKPEFESFLPLMDRALVVALPKVIPLLPARSSIEVPVFANVPWSAAKSLIAKLPFESLRAIVFAVADVDCTNPSK